MGRAAEARDVRWRARGRRGVVILNLVWGDESPRSVAAAEILGLLSDAERIGIGVSWLNAGHDSQSIRELAGLTRAEHDEARELFHRALSDLGEVLPTYETAVLQIALAVADAIVAGKAEPRAAGYLLSDLWWRPGEYDFLLPFYAARHECEDAVQRLTGYRGQEDAVEERWRAFDQEVVVLAAELLDNKLPRS